MHLYWKAEQAAGGVWKGVLRNDEIRMTNVEWKPGGAALAVPIELGARYLVLRTRYLVLSTEY